MNNYFEGKSDKNLIDMIFTAVPTKRDAIFAELQKRQQENNNEQISSLIDEIKKLKDITDKNAKTSAQNAQSDNKLAKIAICIAIISIITQIIFSIHNEIKCNYVISSTSNPNEPQQFNSGCYRIIDLGLLGIRTFQIPDYPTK